MSTPSKHVVAILLIISVSACRVVSRRVEVSPIDQRQPATVTSPVKAHLRDGSTVVYPQGVVVTRDALEGAGTRYDVTLKESEPVTSIPLEVVVGMEAYPLVKQKVASMVLSALSSFGVMVAAVIVGTVAAFSQHGPMLEAQHGPGELGVPLFFPTDHRRIDRLGVNVPAR